MTITTLYKQAFETYKNNFIVIIANTALFVVVSTIVALTIIGLLFLPAFFGGYIKSLIDCARGKEVHIGAFFGQGMHHFGALLGAVILVILAKAALFLPGLYLVLRAVKLNFFRQIDWSLLYGFSYSAGLLLFFGVLLAIYLFIRWFFVIFFIIDTNCSIEESFSRSSAMVRGHWWQLFGYFLLTWLIASIFHSTFIGILFGMPFANLVYAHYYVTRLPQLSLGT